MPIAVRQAFLTAIDKRGHTNLCVQPVLGALKVENISNSNTHCYFTILNHRKKGPVLFCHPALLGIHRTLEQK